jgi:hypothetical protein
MVGLVSHGSPATRRRSDNCAVITRARDNSAAKPEFVSTVVISKATCHVRDLPVAIHSVELLLRVRRFCCIATTCSKRTSAERPSDLAPPRSRRMPRLPSSLRNVGVAHGKVGARLATCVRTGASGDTLLRIFRTTPSSNFPLCWPERPSAWEGLPEVQKAAPVSHEPAVWHDAPVGSGIARSHN